jgi:hypothetical protein
MACQSIRPAATRERDTGDAVTPSNVEQVLNEEAGAETAPAAVMPDGAVPSRSGHLPPA